MNGKRLCPMNHPTNIRGERACRFLSERAMGVLWRHSSVNLVEPRSIALAGPGFPRRLPEIKFRLAPPSPRRNRCGVRRREPWGSQFPINHPCVIQALGFNDLAGDDE